MRAGGPGEAPPGPPPALGAARPAGLPRWAAWLGLPDFNWSLALIGLCAFTFSIVTYRFGIGEFGILVALAGILANAGKMRVPFPVWLYAAFLLWAVMAALVSQWSALAFDTIIERSKLVVIILVVVNTLRTEGQLRMYLFFFLFCFMIYPVRGTLLGGETVFGRAIWGAFMYRNPNDLAALSLFPLGIALGFLFSASAKKVVRAGAGVCAVLLLVVILATQSRGAFLGLVVGMGPALLWSGMKRPLRMLAAGVILGTVIAVAVPSSVWQRFAGMGELTSTATMAQADPEGSAAERLEIAHVAWRIVLDNPVFGIGLGAYPFANAVYNPELGRKSTHNTYLNLAAEVGLPGLIIWLVLAFSVLRYAARARKRAPPGELANTQVWLERATVAYLIDAIFGTFSTLTFPYLFLGVLWCSATLLSRTQAPSGQKGP